MLYRLGEWGRGGGKREREGGGRGREVGRLTERV